MTREIESFASALKMASRAALNTVDSYRRDLQSFRKFLLARNAALDSSGKDIDCESINRDQIRLYLAEMMKTAKRATVQRRLFAIKAFFKYRETAAGSANPTLTMRSPKSERRVPPVLSGDQMQR